ncbi:MAG: AAA family ATPase [Pseudomonadota bacterium]
MILTIAVSGYRSLRDLVLPLERLTVITGANGSGKSSLYRSIRLLSRIARGDAVAAIAQEGGLQSTLWAGPEQFSRAMKRGEMPVQGTVRQGPVSLKLGFADEDYGYAIDLGLPVNGGRMFGRDPEIKCEALWIGERLRRSNAIATRNGPLVQVIDETGTRKITMKSLAPFDSMMTHAANPSEAIELLELRERMRRWRFYDALRTDSTAPARQSQVGTRTMSLASDGADLAAAIQTIMEIGDRRAFSDAVDDAFPGSSAEIIDNDGRFELLMIQRGMLRPLRANELSDGTLRYLLLATALLSPRPPPILVLNEPETSLHPSLLEPLARLIERAARDTQIMVVSHAGVLVDALAAAPNSVCHALQKELGETVVDGHEQQSWAWPKR